GNRSDEPRQLLAGERVGEHGERPVRLRSRKDEVVRRRPQSGGDGTVAVEDEPHVPLGIEIRRVADRPGDPEQEVVARLVGEEQRLGPLEELARFREPRDVHSSSSTRTAPPATRSPSCTCTARTVAAYGETSGVS